MHAQSCLTFCGPVNCSMPGSSVREVSQARILEWVAISSSGESSWHRNGTCVSFISCSDRWIVYHCTIWEAQHLDVSCFFPLFLKYLIRLYMSLFGVFRTFMVNWLLIRLMWVYHLPFYFLLILTPLVFCSAFPVFLFSYDLIFFVLFYFFSFVGLLMTAFCFCYFNGWFSVYGLYL